MGRENEVGLRLTEASEMIQREDGNTIDISFK